MKYTIKKLIPSVFYPLLIKLKYRSVFGLKCNLRNPKTYSEKMQWAKLNRTDALLTRLSDKIEVRNWVREKIGEEYLIPTIGTTYDNAEEIDFDVLPKRFVIKANHGSGFNLVVNDKSILDYSDVRKTLNKWLKLNYAYTSFELQYKGIIPKLYIEKNIAPQEINDLPDYKFFCFSGKVFCSYTMVDYTMNHSNGKLGFFDREYNLLPYHREDFKPIERQLKEPPNYWKMVELAEKLAEGFSHVRVDFYNVDGKIYFGEMTFTNASGYCKFVPQEFDKILGERWDLYTGV
jgi:hypothetical protein